MSWVAAWEKQGMSRPRGRQRDRAEGEQRTRLVHLEANSIHLIYLIPVTLNMSEGITPWSSERFVDKRYISKRSIRKNIISKRHYVPTEKVAVKTDVVDSESDSSINGDTTSLPGSSDTGMIYLNPQTPKWSLAEKFSELSSGEEKGLCAKGYRSPGSPEPVERAIGGSGQGCDMVHCDTLQELEGSRNTLRLHYEDVRGGRTKLDMQTEAPLGRWDYKKDERNGENVKDAAMSDACEEGQVPLFFAAMKKRGVEGDTENRPYKCTYCNWAFKKSSNLQSHLDTHSGLKPHVCDLCGKAYSHQGTLQQHKRLHTGERPYRCPFCVKTYIWSSDYRKHIRTHTGEKPYVCDTCGKDFVRSSDLRKHERNMHTNDKPFPCTECGKTFNKPLSLMRHERTHLGERPFCCPDCGKAFAVASRMAEHRKVHSGVRPFVCAVCAKSFTKSSNLLEHKAVHSGVRPHKCAECGVAFAMASRLVRHQRVHGGEKAFGCAGCGVSFSRPAALKRHQDQACAGRIFICVECDKSFQCASQLSQHVLSHRGKTV